MDPATTITSERRLTERQQDCVRLVAKGLSSKEISRELGISPSTVDNHIAAVVIKLNLKNRHELVQMLYKRLSADEEKPGSDAIFFVNGSSTPEDSSLVEFKARNNIAPITIHIERFKFEIRVVLYIILILLTINTFF